MSNNYKKSIPLEKEELEHLTKRIAKGGSIYFLGSLIGKIVTLLFQVLLGRTLGTSAYGLYALGFSITGIFRSISTLGLNHGIVRYGAIYIGENQKAKVKNTLAAAFSISLTFSMIIAVALFIFSDYISANIFNKPDLTGVLKIFSLAIPFYVLSIMSAYTARAFQKMEYDTGLTNVFQPVMNLIFVSLAFMLGYGLYGAVIGILISAILSALLGLYLVWRIFPEITDAVKPLIESKKLLRFSLPLLFANLAYFLLLQIDRITIGYFRGSGDVGIYNAASMFALQVTMFVMVFSNIFSPIISDLHNRKKMESLEEALKVTTKWTFSVSLPIFLILILFSQDVMGIFGPEFKIGWNVLIILAISQLAITVIGPSSILLQMGGKQDIVFFDTLIAFILNLILNVWLIQIYGIIGAAIATGFSLTFLSFIIFFQTHRTFKMNPFNIRYLKPIGAGMISILAITLINLSIEIQWVLSMSIILLIYICILYLLGLDREDTVVKEAIKRKLKH
jgi:O-antigen/teichoic acid export membrane protein